MSDAKIVYVGKPVPTIGRKDEYNYMVAYGPLPVPAPAVRSTCERVKTSDVRAAWRHQKAFVAANAQHLHPRAVISSMPLDPVS